MCPARVGDVVGLVDDMGGKYTIILSLVLINIYSSSIKCLNCGICLFICRFCKVLFILVLSSGLLGAPAGTFFRSPANKIGVRFLIRQVQRLSADCGGGCLWCCANGEPSEGGKREVWVLRNIYRKLTFAFSHSELWRHSSQLGPRGING